MNVRLQLVATLLAGGLFFFIFELVRRKRLMERYALLWLFASVVLFGLAIWGGALKWLATAVGVSYGPSALFAVAFGFVLVLLLHFSVIISRLSEQNKVLAQKLGLLEERVSSTDERPLALQSGMLDNAPGD